MIMYDSLNKTNIWQTKHLLQTWFTYGQGLDLIVAQRNYNGKHSMSTG
jgi:hypothetical protein